MARALLPAKRCGRHEPKKFPEDILKTRNSCPLRSRAEPLRVTRIYKYSERKMPRLDLKAAPEVIPRGQECPRHTSLLDPGMPQVAFF
jgi:hypothetical protein